MSRIHSIVFQGNKSTSVPVEFLPVLVQLNGEPLEKSLIGCFFAGGIGNHQLVLGKN